MAYTTIDDPFKFFNTVLYTGNGSSQSITGVGHQPDWTWIKSRGSTAFHLSTDSVRGVTKQLYPNADTAENTDSSHITAFNTDGFSVGSAGDVNGNSLNLVSWNWKAGGSASSNSDGSITSSVSANTTAGFSIVSYTGTGSNATVGHGLGAVPKMIIFKDRETSVDWGVYAEPNGNTKEMYLSTNDAAGTNTNAFNSTTPTSSVFTIGTSSRYNPSSKGVIAYCFANVKGYSKIGSYTGNGNADGTFIYTGFKPAWILLKQSSASGAGWRMHDNKRGISGNPEDETLYASSSNAESTGRDVDFLSNGFKLRTDSGDGNGSGSTYIYMAFAESPFVTAGTKAAGTAR
jgi:hypothetical protein